MAEAVDRPSAGEELMLPPPPAVADAPELTAEGERYRPLSLLAVAGFGLAAVYAAVVSLGGLAAFHAQFPRTLKLLVVLVPALAVVGAAAGRVRPGRLLAVGGLALLALLGGLGMASLVAFSGTNPWLLPPWTLALPLGAALLCWMARVRIQGSEGTLSGTRLTTWGIGLSLVFGLNYGAYFASTLLAVRSQAADFVEDWLREIQEDKVEQAFLRTIRPSSRPPEGPDLRGVLEAQFNQPRSLNEPGPYSRFERAEYVRLLRCSGEVKKIERTGYASESVPGGGYLVKLQYRITTDLVAFNLSVRLAGSDVRSKRAVGRQWFIETEGTGSGGIDETDKGQAIFAAARNAARTADVWLRLLQIGEVEGAYLETLPPADRKSQSAAEGRLLAVGAAAGLAPLGRLARRPENRPLVDGRQAFVGGAALLTDGFWAGDTKTREEVLAEVKRLFGGGAPAAGLSVGLQPNALPFWEVDGGVFRLHYPARIMIREAGKEVPRYLAEAEVLLESAVGGDDLPAGPWRVRGLRLLRAHTAPLREAPDRLGPG